MTSGVLHKDGCLVAVFSLSWPNPSSFGPEKVLVTDYLRWFGLHFLHAMATGPSPRMHRRVR
jgi:hypothetical protein